MQPKKPKSLTDKIKQVIKILNRMDLRNPLNEKRFIRLSILLDDWMDELSRQIVTSRPIGNYKKDHF